VDADNLAGEPVRITLTNKTPAVQLLLNEKELKQLENKLSEGIVYNVPGKADLVIEFQNKVLFNKEVDVVQYGSQDVLARRMFENQKQPIQVHFHSELGANKQIIQ
jgi:allophanate hydrolase subunit 1